MELRALIIYLSASRKSNYLISFETARDLKPQNISAKLEKRGNKSLLTVLFLLKV